MWVLPTLTSGSSLGKTKWKCMQQSRHFILQQGPSETSKDGVSYRIVTRSFPTYIIGCSETLPPSLDHFRFLHEEFLEQMPPKKPNELIKNIKAYYLNFPDYQPPSADTNVNEEAETAKLNARIEKALSRHISPSELMSFAEESDVSENESRLSHSNSFETVDSFEGHREAKTQDSETLQDAQDSTHRSGAEEREILVSHGLDVDLIPGMEYETRGVSFPLFERVYYVFDSLFGLPHGVREIRYDSGFRGFFRRLVTLIHYPSIYLEDGAYKTTFQFLSEVQATNARRKVLLGLIVYSFMIHFCSLDLFFVLLFLGSCTLLFFMRDSFLVNFVISTSKQSRVSSGSIGTIKAPTSNEGNGAQINEQGEPKSPRPEPTPTKSSPRSRAMSRRQNLEATQEDQTSKHLGSFVSLPPKRAPYQEDQAPKHLGSFVSLPPKRAPYQEDQTPKHLGSFVSLPPKRAPAQEMRRPSSSDRLGALNQLTSPLARPTLPNLRTDHAPTKRAANDNTLSVIFPANY